MHGAVTILWLVDSSNASLRRNDEFKHVDSDGIGYAGTITRLIMEGPVLVVVRTEEEGERAIAFGADEVAYLSDLEASGERVLARTLARARARTHRDLFLIDLVRKDDTAALELITAALGEELVAPLAQAASESEKLVGALGARRTSAAAQAKRIAETVSGAAAVVEKMRELVTTERSDEVVDLSAIAREVGQALAAGVRPIAHFETRILQRACLVALPRWQVVMMVASLISNALDSVASAAGRQHTVRLSVTTEEGAAVLEVADTGDGMQGDERTGATAPFFTTTEKRLGLGLTLVAARVRRAGGELIIESDPGVGTSVRAFLPLLGGVDRSALEN